MSRFLAITRPDYSPYDAISNPNCFIRICERRIYFSSAPKRTKKIKRMKLSRLTYFKPEFLKTCRETNIERAAVARFLRVTYHDIFGATVISTLLSQSKERVAQTIVKYINIAQREF